MWIGRRPDGTVYGLFATKQVDDEFHLRMEEISENHPDVIAFRNRPRLVVIDPRDVKIAELETRLVAIESARI